MTNAPTFRDFIAECAGTRNWYTRPKPAPVKARGKQYISPKAFAGIKLNYVALFGVSPV